MERELLQEANVVRQFNRFYTVHLGLLRGRYLGTEFSLSESRVLYELAQHPACTANSLCGRLGLDAGYMSRLVRSLTERGLVQGTRSTQDKRAMLLSLTPNGRAASDDINQRVSAETIQMLSHLDDAQRVRLLDAMHTIQDILSPSSLRIVRATAAQATDARILLHEYFDLIDVVLRDDDRALASLLTDPGSAMWIAYIDEVPAACVAMRPLPQIAGAAECKRLYVAEPYRQRGLSMALMRTLEQHAARVGYGAVYLDTKGDLYPAIRLYEKLGYQPCERYNDNPQATVFMRKPLGSTQA